MATSSHRPEGSRLKLRGQSPSVGTTWSSARAPVDSATMNTAMLLWPRFDTYNHFPDGCTSISAVVLSPVKYAGSVETVWISFKTPEPDAYANAVTVELVRESGYTHACSGVAARVEPTVDPFQIPRLQVPDCDGARFADLLNEWFSTA